MDGAAARAEAERTLAYWLRSRLPVRCMQGKQTLDYRLLSLRMDVYAQMSFHRNGVLARWAPCYKASSTVTTWTADGELRSTTQVHGSKRHGLHIEYIHGIPMKASTWSSGKKDGIVWTGSQVAFYSHGKILGIPWNQEGLTHAALYDLSERLLSLMDLGARDIGEALATASYEGHLASMKILLTEPYPRSVLAYARAEALRNGHMDAVHLLDTLLPPPPPTLMTTLRALAAQALDVVLQALP